MVQQRHHLLQVQASVPSYFLCPISLELMRDPVTVSSGQTYDRPSIEAWLGQGHDTCPVTRLPLYPACEEPIPNHVLRRIIQAWCEENESLGIERIATPRPPASSSDIRLLISQLLSPSTDCLDILRQLHRLALDQPRARRHMIQAGALSQLPLLLLHGSWAAATCSTPRALSPAKDEEALCLISLLLEDASAAAPFWRPSDAVIAILGKFVVSGGMKAQYATFILGSACTHHSDTTKKNLASTDGIVHGVLNVIRISEAPQSCAAALKLIEQICSCSSRNRWMAVEASAVQVLVEQLERDGPDRKARVEASLKALGVLCQCAEGRAAVAERQQSLRMVVGAMSGVSERASKHAAVVLWQVLKWSPMGSGAKKEALAAGAFVKALALAQCTTSAETSHLCRRIAKALSPSPATAISHLCM